jgi:5-methylthioribose kinase
MNKLEIFRAQFPDAHFFDESRLDHLGDYLKEKGIIELTEKIKTIEKPGEGNMNFVRRVRTDKKSFIVKQCRPWVEKYPDIKAPVERLKTEQTYYDFISGIPFFSRFTPKIVYYDPDNLTLILEDLGESTDFTFIYKKGAEIKQSQLDALMKYITQLHHSNWGEQNKRFPLNLALRRLNHEHIFYYPYLPENGFNLDTVQDGLEMLALPIKQNEVLKESIFDLGRKYLSQGPVLIHGDYYPGSWLQAQDEVKVIDPEFAFFGFAEFDIAIMTAHFFVSEMHMDDVKQALKGYGKRRDFDRNLFMGFCGTEILRRIIGLAQLPLDLSLNERAELLDLAQQFITSPKSYQLL